jgi:hypothetical protein
MPQEDESTELKQSTPEKGTDVMYIVPIDPMEELQCESCQ